MLLNIECLTTDAGNINNTLLQFSHEYCRKSSTSSNSFVYVGVDWHVHKTKNKRLTLIITHDRKIVMDDFRSKSGFN